MERTKAQTSVMTEKCIKHIQWERKKKKKRSPSRDFSLEKTKAQTSVMTASPVRTVLADRADASYFHVSRTAES